jgi:hypothetical protein
MSVALFKQRHLADGLDADDVRQLFTTANMSLTPDLEEYVFGYLGPPQLAHLAGVSHTAANCVDRWERHIQSQVALALYAEATPTVLLDQESKVIVDLTAMALLRPLKWIQTRQIASCINTCASSVVHILMLLNNQAGYNSESYAGALRDDRLAQHFRGGTTTIEFAEQTLHRIFALLSAVMIQVAMSDHYELVLASPLFPPQCGVSLCRMFQVMLEALSYMRDQTRFSAIWSLLRWTMEQVLYDFDHTSKGMRETVDILVGPLMNPAHYGSWRTGHRHQDAQDIDQLYDLGNLSGRFFHPKSIWYLCNCLDHHYQELRDYERTISHNEARFVSALRLFGLFVVAPVSCVAPLLLDCVLFTMNMDAISTTASTGEAKNDDVELSPFCVILGRLLQRHPTSLHQIKMASFAVHPSAAPLLFAVLETCCGVPAVVVT